MTTDFKERRIAQITPAQRARLAAYVAERGNGRMRGIDPERIHDMHEGTERWVTLRLLDVAALLAATEPQWLATTPTPPLADLVAKVLEWQAAHRNEQEDELALRRVNAAEDALLAWATAPQPAPAPTPVGGTPAPENVDG